MYERRSIKHFVLADALRLYLKPTPEKLIKPISDLRRSDLRRFRWLLCLRAEFMGHVGIRTKRGVSSGRRGQVRAKENPPYQRRPRNSDRVRINFEHTSQWIFYLGLNCLHLRSMQPAFQCKIQLSVLPTLLNCEGINEMLFWKQRGCLQSEKVDVDIVGKWLWWQINFFGGLVTLWAILAKEKVV